jgi:S-(hydroxymethyl)glutathione dehydrogenase/alcohol dehydrogenase
MMTRRAGACVVVGMAPLGSVVEISPVDLFLHEKRLLGCYYGSVRPRIDVPRIINLYRQGKIKLDELVSRTYAIEEVNDAFDAMKRGEVARGVITYGV